MKDPSIKKLSTAPVKKFKNKERFSLFERIITKIDECDIDDSHIEMLINNAKRHIKIHDELSKTPMAHEVTPDIKDKFEACRGYLTRIKDTVDSLRNIPDAEEKSMYKTLKYWMLSARRFMTSYAMVDQIEAVRALNAGYVSNPQIAEYLEELNINKSFEKAVELNKQIIDLGNERSEDRGYFKNVRSGSREASLFDLQLLFNALVTMANIGNMDQAMYQGLCRTLDTMLIEAHAVWKARITRIANGEEVEDGNDSEYDDSDIKDSNPDDSSEDDDSAESDNQ